MSVTHVPSPSIMSPPLSNGATSRIGLPLSSNPTVCLSAVIEPGPVTISHILPAFILTLHLPSGFSIELLKPTFCLSFVDIIDPINTAAGSIRIPFSAVISKSALPIL